MANGNGTFSARERLMWWVKLIGIAIPLAMGMSTAAIGLGKWIYTRASTDDVAETEAKLDVKKEDKTNAARERGRIESKIDRSAGVQSNMRDNMIIIMERLRAKPKPLPAKFSTPLDDYIENLEP